MGSTKIPISPEVRTQLIKEFADAIAHEEGFYLTEVQARQRKIPFPSLCQRNCNPGNLRAWGSFEKVDGYVNFGKPELGWQALQKQCDRNIFDRELTFFEFFAGQRNDKGELIHPTKSYGGFAPANDNDIKHGINRPGNYAQHVFDRLKESVTFKDKDWTQLSINSKIKSLVA